MIPVEQYAQIVDLLPILCVDIVVVNSRGKYLLVRRANEPLKNRWWVLGGRVLKGETLEQAAIRKVREEAGLNIENLRPVGYYEGVFSENALGVSSGVHTVSVVFQAVCDQSDVQLDGQSSEWRYADELPGDFRIISIGGSPA